MEENTMSLEERNRRFGGVYRLVQEAMPEDGDMMPTRRHPEFELTMTLLDPEPHASSSFSTTVAADQS